MYESKEHLMKCLNKNTRSDGRKLAEYRPVAVKYGFSKSAEGSANVRIGDTEVLVGVKLGIEKPYSDTPDRGNLMVNAELRPLSNPKFEPGPPGDQAVELARVVDRGIREAKAIDVKKLCIKEGEKIWMVFIDIYPLNDDGNLVDASVLDQYEKGSAIAFPNYSLLRLPDGAIYLIVNDTRRWINSMETFTAIGFVEDEIIDVTDDDLDAYEDGDPLTLASADPHGHLNQNKETGGVYFVEDGIKHPLVSRTVLEVNFKNWQILPTSPEELEAFKTSGPVLLPDGALVKSVSANKSSL